MKTHRAIAAVTRVQDLHSPIRRYTLACPDRWEDNPTCETPDELIEAYNHTITTADVVALEICAECSRLEVDTQDPNGELRGYQESVWPCKTWRVLEAGLLGRAND